MKRTSKRYVVSTSALNCYGYRVLTGGVELSQFLKNPVVYWIHKKGDYKLPLGRAVDVKVEGDEITCAIDFTEADPFALKIYDMMEEGTISMMSLGALPLEVSVEPADLLQGQTGPTVTKCKALEFSVADMGGNDDALPVELYDANDNPIELSSLTGEGMIELFSSLKKINPTENNMKLIQLTGQSLSGILLNLKLTDAATEVEVLEKVNELVQLNTDLGAQIITLKASENKVKAELAAAIELANTAKIEGVIKEAGDKLLPAQIANFKVLLAADFDAAKAMIDALPPSKTVAEAVGAAKKNTLSEKAIQLSYDDMDKQGLLTALKAENIDLFKSKFQEKFGTEYKG